jgi:transposase
MSGRRPLIKDSFAVSRGSWVRSCLRPGCAGIAAGRSRASRMWAKKLIEKKPFKLVAVALANKMARIAFAILRSKTVYREIPA